MTPETNWLNLFGKYTSEGITWHSQTTVYSLEFEIIRAYKFTRKFSMNKDKTVVYHENKYNLPDGSVKEQNWEISKDKCNQADGVFHPEAENMRTIGFGNGSSIWVSKQIIEDKNFGSEIFIKQDDLRYGLISVYDKGKLERFVIIKENANDFPTSINEETIDNFSGKWRIKQIEISPNLEDIEEEFITENINSYLNVDDNKTYNLPEKVRFHLPENINYNQKFTISVGKLISDHIYQQVTSKYDEKGTLQKLISSRCEKII